MHTAITVIVIGAVFFAGLSLYTALFGPDLPYEVKHSPEDPLDSAYFRRLLSTLTQSEMLGGNKVEVLTNGNCFYDRELEAIGRAERTINLEAYIFHPSRIGLQFVRALAERARAGVKVRLTLDYIGSLSTFRSYFAQLIEAGGQLEWYHPLDFRSLLQVNNRTHRELLVVDGSVAFIGGAGIADQWCGGKDGNPQWRDTVLCIEGPAVSMLQSVFAQNWLRVSGEIMTSEDDFQFARDGITSPSLVVSSTPAAGSTPARILFQTLIASAKEQIYISTPYFLPDRSARRAIIKAVCERNVQVKILTPGSRSDQVMTRASSRQLYGDLLKHGVEIHEYEPAMIHVKAMMVDRCWAVVGSTNFDYRSFELNDEVNLAILDQQVTKRLAHDFEQDLAASRRIGYEDWRKKMRYRIADKLMDFLEREE